MRISTDNLLNNKQKVVYSRPHHEYFWCFKTSSSTLDVLTIERSKHKNITCLKFTFNVDRSEKNVYINENILNKLLSEAKLDVNHNYQIGLKQTYTSSENLRNMHSSWIIFNLLGGSGVGRQRIYMSLTSEGFIKQMKIYENSEEARREDSDKLIFNQFNLSLSERYHANSNKVTASI